MNEKGIQIGKEEAKLLSFTDMINYVENLIKSTKKKATRIHNFRKIAGYKVSRKHSIVFLHTSKEQSEIEIKNINSIKK